jgi:hypothetical protein
MKMMKMKMKMGSGLISILAPAPTERPDFFA